MTVLSTKRHEKSILLQLLVRNTNIYGKPSGVTPELYGLIDRNERPREAWQNELIRITKIKMWLLVTGLGVPRSPRSLFLPRLVSEREEVNYYHNHSFTFSPYPLPSPLFYLYITTTPE